MKKSKKGVSPVVATVLLIGMVVVIGLIIFLWFRGFVGSACEKFDRNCELTCEDVQFDTSYSSNELYVSNIGDIPVYGLKIRINQGGEFTTEDIRDLSSNWPEYGLFQGVSFSDTISIGSPDSITVIPVLLGASNSGQEFFVCEERYGYEIQAS